MVCAISATSSSVVTKGGQICSVLLWMVHASPTDSPGLITTSRLPD